MTVDFQPGINVIIGENNAGKTALLRALCIVFDRRTITFNDLRQSNR
ncbi:MAG: AAA family ATPase [Thermoguttaceae bacterium]